MDSVEKLKECTDSILAGDGTTETLSQMQEYVIQIAAGSVPWHLSEKQLNLELFDVLRKLWNFSLSLEKTTKKAERGEYFGMLRYFCVGIVLFLVVERGINENGDADKEEQQQLIPEEEDDAASANKLKALSMFQLLKMTLNTGKVCLDHVPDAEKAQHCFQIVSQHYGKIREVGQPKQIQLVLREIVRILYADGKKVFQFETEDQEVLKDLLTAASVLAKDCQDEGGCLGALCLRNGVRLAGMGRHWKAAVWLTAATWNAHFLDDHNHSLARKRLAQVYFDLGVINDFPDVIAGLDKANALAFSLTGGLLKLKIVLSGKASQASDPLDEEVESLIVNLLDRVQVGFVEVIVGDLENLGFVAAAMFALNHALVPTGNASALANCDTASFGHYLNLHLLRINKGLVKPDLVNPEKLRHQQRRDLYRFLTNDSTHRFAEEVTLTGKSRKLPASLHPTLWNLAKACVNRGDLRESVDWYRLSLTFLSSASSTQSKDQQLRRQTEGKLRRNLAKCFVVLGDFSAATREVEAALRIDPNCLLSVYRNFTIHLYSGRDLVSTLRAFDQFFVVAIRIGASLPPPDDCRSGETVDVDSVVSLALDETFKSPRLDVIEGVINQTLDEARQSMLSSQTRLVVLRRALMLLFEQQDATSTAKRIHYLRMAFEILKENIQKSAGDGDRGLRRSMLSEVDWFTPMAWNTIGTSKTEASMENFMLTFKFLALKEVKIRESLRLETVNREKASEAAEPKSESGNEAKRKPSMAGTLHVNLDMQDQMLTNAVDAGLRRVGVMVAKNRGDVEAQGNDVSSSTNAMAVTLGETLETLYKICEKRRRVLAELESVSGAASPPLLRSKLMASIYHFEICAKTQRQSQMSSLLSEIASLATLVCESASFPVYTVFESLIDFCLEPPADRLLNRLIACDCFILAMKSRTAALKRPASTPPSTNQSPTPLLSLPKVFEHALDFVASVNGFLKGEMAVVAERMSNGFAHFLTSTTPAGQLKEGEASCSLLSLALKSFDLGLRCRGEGENEAAGKWLRLSHTLATKCGSKDLQSKSKAQLESLTNALSKQ